MSDEFEKIKTESDVVPDVAKSKWEHIATHAAESSPENKSEGLSDVDAIDPTLLALQKLLAETEQKAEENWQKCLRVQAEMDNLRRRSEQDIVNAHKFSLEKFVKDLLAVVDSFDSAVSTKPVENNNQENSEFFVRMQEGLMLTHRMLLTTLEKFGVTVVDPLGEIFNPDLHQAMSVQDNKEVPANSVVAVLQKGYCLQGRLLRPALVMIAQ